MRSKLWITLLLIIALSVATLMALGIKLARDERRVLFSQYRELYQARLKDYRAGIHAALGAKTEDVRRRLLALEPGPTTIRQLAESSGLITQVFAIEPTGNVILPDPGGPLSSAEQRFLERTRSIMEEGSLQQVLAGSADGQGWYPYFWEDGLHLLYAVRWKGGIRGVELNKLRLYSDIVALLPDNSFFGSHFRSRQVILLDEKGNTLYKWGAVPVDEQIDPIVVLNLLSPLDGLQFRYYVPKSLWDKPFYSSAFFTIIPAVLLVISILLMLAVYFYREHTREVREASQRVNFVNQVSHELKTPLTNIRMYAELLEQRLDEEDQKSSEHLGVIVSESQRLSRLITGILTFSLKEKDKLEIHPTPGRVSEIALDVIEQFRPSLAEANIRIATAVHDDAAVLVDSDFLQQILGNLITNVQKYAAGGKYLSIDCSRQGDVSVLRVCDRGPGIPMDARDRIFDAFYRSSNELTDGISGTGIGLSISRDLARLHGGDLRVIDSDKGACFLVLLKTPLQEKGKHAPKEVR